MIREQFVNGNAQWSAPTASMVAPTVNTVGFCFLWCVNILR